MIFEEIIKVIFADLWCNVIELSFHVLHHHSIQIHIISIQEWGFIDYRLYSKIISLVRFGARMLVEMTCG